MNEMDSRYHVGDKVRIIIDELSPEEIDDLGGTEHEVKSVVWCDLCGRYEYRVKRNSDLWCDDDFEFAAPVDLPEFDTSESDLSSLFSL